jgi:ATP-dependent Lhr-like helicase
LRRRGASFDHELAAATSLDAAETAAALSRLVAAGLISSDGFGGLRSLLRSPAAPPTRGRGHVAGRWTLVRQAAIDVEAQARRLLRRYGIVFRRLLAREADAAPWRELCRVFRTLEARGEIRGGRFVSGMSGEQFALPEAVERLREVRRTRPDGALIAISAADPLNLAGIVTAGERVRTHAGNRLVFCDGVPLAAMEGDYLRPLSEVPPGVASQVATTLAGRPVPSVLSGYVGRI